MNLDRERLALLRAIAADEDVALVYDPELPSRLRVALAMLARADGPEQRSAAFERLDELRRTHGPPFLRCLLEHAWLLHSVTDEREALRPVLDELAAECRAKPALVESVLRLLSHFRDSPYDTTQVVGEEMLSCLRAVDGALPRATRDHALAFALRLDAAALLVESDPSGAVGDLVALCAEQCQGWSEDDSQEYFTRHIRPTVELLARSGEAGVGAAVEAFERGAFGRHGGYVIAAFGDHFHRWFVHHEPSPSGEWVQVLLQAWRRPRKLENRDHLLSVLVDDWTRHGGLGSYIRDRLREKLDNSPTWLAACSAGLRRQVEGFVGRREEDASANHVEGLADAAARSEEAVCGYLEGQRLNQRMGWAAGNAIGRMRDATLRGRLLRAVLAQDEHKGRFFTGFFNRVLLPAVFRNLGPEEQEAIVDSPLAVRFATTERLDGLAGVRMSKAAADRVRVLGRTLSPLGPRKDGNVELV